jgi:tRNA U34 5-methylaminomethyl-2-thiouridine-forming methyltransferase MnmC
MESTQAEDEIQTPIYLPTARPLKSPYTLLYQSTMSTRKVPAEAAGLRDRILALEAELEDIVTNQVGPQHLEEVFQCVHAEENNKPIPRNGVLAKAAKMFMQLQEMEDWLEKWEKENWQIL